MLEILISKPNLLSENLKNYLKIIINYLKNLNNKINQKAVLRELNGLKKFSKGFLPVLRC